MNIFDYNKLEIYSESELNLFIRKIESDIEYQQSVMKALENRLEFLKLDRAKHEKIIKERQKYEQFLRCQANAERIEKRISNYLVKNWYRFQFLFSKPLKPYDPSLIHFKYQSSNVALPRLIMVHFIEKLSGLNHTQVASYFDLTPNASLVNYAKKTINGYMCYPEFKVIIEEISDSLRILIPKKGNAQNIVKSKKMIA